MTARAAPPWLGALQAAFGALLREPLDRAAGTLRARTEAYPEGLCVLVRAGPRKAPRERLAVYHRQYWFRLLTALQDDFPLVARLLGYWEFNDWAARYLAASPSTSADLQQVADGFPGFLEASLPRAPLPGAAGVLVPRAALLQAAAIDAAWRDVLSAPLERPFDAAALAPERLPDTRLRRAASFALVEERWPLCQLRRELAASPADQPARLPAPLEAGRWILLGRTGLTLVERELAPLHARLLQLLGARPFGAALAALEAGCTEAERRDLPGQVEAWLAEAVRLGLFRAGEP